MRKWKGIKSYQDARLISVTMVWCAEDIFLEKTICFRCWDDSGLIEKTKKQCVTGPRSYHA